MAKNKFKLFTEAEEFCCMFTKPCADHEMCRPFCVTHLDDLECESSWDFAVESDVRFLKQAMRKDGIRSMKARWKRI